MRRGNVELYLNDMETPILTAVTTKLDGDYAGIYFPNSNGCVINSVKINGEIIMGYESWSRPLDDTAVYSQPADADVTLEMGFGAHRGRSGLWPVRAPGWNDSVTSWEAVSGGGQGVGVSFSTSGGLRIGEEHWDITQEAAVLNRDAHPSDDPEREQRQSVHRRPGARFDHHRTSCRQLRGLPRAGEQRGRGALFQSR